MNRLKFFSIALLVFGASVQAQDLESAKKAIDAEQYAKAKTILKNLIVTKPESGKNFFILGNLYLTQKLPDSAKIAYDNGLRAKNESHFNNIGLGQIELDNANKAGAKTAFDKAIVNIRKKDVEELMYIGKAYCNSSNPDYKTAIEYLMRAEKAQPTDAQVQLALGDAYAGDKNVNDAYRAYRNAADADKSLLAAKLKLGVLTKNSKAFVEAKATFEGILAIDPNYGPAYRELAETYYVWALNDKAKAEEYNKKAIEYYDIYLSKTDYSVDSRMRHADFLILTKEYKALEAEANAMAKLDKVNARILRYLGYSAYENGNNDEAIKALNNFFAAPNVKIIGRDYMYLGFAKASKSLVTTKTATATTGTVDKVLFDSAIADIRKGVEIDPVMANELNDFGKKFFDLKLYKEAAAVYDVAVLNPNSKNYLYDNYYLGYSLYYDNANKPAGQKVDVPSLQKGLTAFSNVIAAAPAFQDAYIYKARINSLMESDAAAQEEMVKNYEQYIQVVTGKGEAEMSKPATKTKFIEAYNNIGIHYMKTDKVKAKENFAKALAIDPKDETATSNLKLLK